MKVLDDCNLNCPTTERNVLIRAIECQCVTGNFIKFLNGGGLDSHRHNMFGTIGKGLKRSEDVLDGRRVEFATVKHKFTIG